MTQVLVSVAGASTSWRPPSTEFATNQGKHVSVDINGCSVNSTYPSLGQSQNVMVYTLHCLLKPKLPSLVVVQSEAMRILISTPQTTGIENIGTDINLPSIYERSGSLSPAFGVEAVGGPTLLPFGQSNLQRQSKPSNESGVNGNTDLDSNSCLQGMCKVQHSHHEQDSTYVCITT